MRERSQHFDPRQTMQRQDFEVFHYREPKPEEVEVHHHDFYEVYFFLGGEIEYWVEGHIYRLQPGDLLLINPMELHRPMIDRKNSVYERIVLWINKNYLNSLTDEDTSLTQCFDTGNPTHRNLIRLTKMQRSDITARLGELIRESYSKDFGGRLCATGIFMQFMVELNRIASHSAAHSVEQQETPELVTKVLAYIGGHYNEDLSLEGLSQRFFVSKYHLSHEFTKAVGIGVYRYIMLKRLLMAKQMLTDGNPPGEVYAKCGFGDYTNFFRAFKAEYGVSPSAYASEKG